MNSEEMAGRSNVIDLLERVSERIGSLERKVEAIAIPPKAFRIEEAERFLPLKKSAINALIRSGELKTITYGKSPRRYIPMSEIVRLNSIPEGPVSAPAVPSKVAKPRATKLAESEAKEILELAKRIKTRRSP